MGSALQIVALIAVTVGVFLRYGIGAGLIVGGVLLFAVGLEVEFSSRRSRRLAKQAG